MGNLNNLVIVESPSKAKTIGKYLGPGYTVRASMGHLRDLPKSTMGVDLEGNFDPHYIPVRGKEDLIKELNKETLAKEKPVVQIGDTVRVHVKVKEGSRERIQIFEGTVIAKKHGGIEETITVRRISYGVGVEKVFPVHSPSIDTIQVIRSGKVRRAKLYYLRGRVGKGAKIKEKL